MRGSTPCDRRTLRRAFRAALVALLCLLPPGAGADEPAPAAAETQPQPATDRPVEGSARPGKADGRPLGGNRPPTKPPSGPPARPEDPATTGVFGVQGTGRRFVYVVDCSASMADEGGRALEAARKDIAKSIGHLHKGNEFAILSYSTVIERFPGGVGVKGFAAWSSDNVLRAKDFLVRRTAAGNATHAKAIDEALVMKPDVVFVITDSHVRADITRKQLGELLESSRGAKIMVAHLASAAVQRCPNLAELAGKTGGRYEAFSYDGKAWTPAVEAAAAANDRPPATDRPAAAVESR